MNFNSRINSTNSLLSLALFLFLSQSLASTTIAQGAVLKDGFPLYTSRMNNSYLQPTYFSVSNVDLDPELEIVYQEPLTRYSYVWEHDGKLKQGWPNYKNLDLGLNGNLMLVTGNFSENTPNYEIIGTTWGSAVKGQNSGMIGFDGNGELLNSYFQLATDDSIFFGVIPPLAVDTNNDGFDELIVAGSTKPSIRYHTGEKIESAYDFSLRQYMAYAAADSDSDGNVEIIGRGQLTNELHRIFAFDSSMVVMNGWPKDIAAKEMFNPLYADTNGDGLLEAIFPYWYNKWDKGFKIFNKDGEDVGSFLIAENIAIKSQPVAADLNYDGSAEIIMFQSESGVSGYSLAVYQSNGEYFQGWPIKTEPSLHFFNTCSACGVAIGDVDGDKSADIVTLAEHHAKNGEVDGFSVNVYDSEGNLKQNHNELFTDNSLNGRRVSLFNPVISDIDKDGINDVLVYEHSSSWEQDNEGRYPTIWAFNFKQFGNRLNGHILWAQFGSDEKNSYKARVTPSNEIRTIDINQIERISVPYLGSSEFELSFTDSIDSASHKFDISFEREHINAQISNIENNKVTVKFESMIGFEGDTSIVLFVENEQNPDNFQTKFVQVKVKENLPPTIHNDEFDHVIDSEPTVINVSTNDVDPEGRLDTRSVKIITDPNEGSIELQPDGTIKYTLDNYCCSTRVLIQYVIYDIEGKPATKAGFAYINIKKAVAPTPEPVVTSNSEQSGGGGSLGTGLLVLSLLLLFARQRH